MALQLLVKTGFMLLTGWVTARFPPDPPPSPSSPMPGKDNIFEFFPEIKFLFQLKFWMFLLLSFSPNLFLSWLQVLQCLHWTKYPRNPRNFFGAIKQDVQNKVEDKYLCPNSSTKQLPGNEWQGFLSENTVLMIFNLITPSYRSWIFGILCFVAFY